MYILVQRLPVSGYQLLGRAWLRKIAHPSFWIQRRGLVEISTVFISTQNSCLGRSPPTFRRMSIPVGWLDWAVIFFAWIWKVTKERVPAFATVNKLRGEPTATVNNLPKSWWSNYYFWLVSNIGIQISKTTKIHTVQFPHPIVTRQNTNAKFRKRNNGFRTINPIKVLDVQWSITGSM